MTPRMCPRAWSVPLVALLIPTASCGESSSNPSSGGPDAALEVSAGGQAGSSANGGSAGQDAASGGAAGSTGGTAGAAGTGGAGGSGGAPLPHSYRCDPVGTTPTDGIFAMREFGSNLFVGLFGYGHTSESMLFEYPPWGRVEPGLRGVAESVCAMKEFQGHLYANTESDGYLYRSSNGSDWQRVYDGGPGWIGCGLEVHGGELYAVQYDYATHRSGKILRSADGLTWNTVFDSGNEDLYLRHLVAHEGVLYALGVRENESLGQLLVSVNGTDWTSADTPTRFFRALSWNGELYLSSTTSRSQGPTGIWAFHGGSPEMVHAVGAEYVTELAAWDSSLWAGTSDGWKEATGDSSLLMSRDGVTWETVCTFPEAAAWSVAPSGDHLYVGTWEYGSHGKLYEVSVDEGSAGAGGGTGVDCSLISSANSAWEVCESTVGHCAGVFADGAGCDAFCAAAGLACFAKFGGEPGCVKEPNTVLGCGDGTHHQSDWCECR